ncbi:hypothetical protein SAMN05421820_103511 [Pedobacter steynii]|uniref:Uncharacterized protein n=1 Tax=Pedobacter steynii TaxID=430522 RepID=A0A1G9S925_9SPHI|nr:hypothetical protein [Pedobacter steynii]NQX37503.1 hypothetical protein [Pedobacter steynii]SDM31964.1 hypothetical protein SAMN05421820_103511 [Pedobacter steynii]
MILKIDFNRHNLKLPVYGFAFLLLFFAHGCKKQKPLTDALQEEERTEPLKEMLIPIKIEIGKLVTELKYQDGKSVLNEISHPNGEVWKIVYTKAGYPQRLEQYKNNKQFRYFNYALDAEFRISKIQSWNKDNANLTLAHLYVVGYDKQSVVSIKKYDPASNLVEEETLAYTTSGNPEAIIWDNKNVIDAQRWTYDDKSGIFSKLPYARLFFLEQAYRDFSMGNSNPLSTSSLKNPSENKTFSYTYNSSGYPSEIIIKKGGSTETMKITYRVIKPG